MAVGNKKSVGMREHKREEFLVVLSETRRNPD